LWHSVSGKGEKGAEHSATVALPSPFAIYNGCFELGLGQSMVRLTIFFVYAYVWTKIHLHSLLLTGDFFFVVLGFC
jgi:hypothetical protein